MLFSKALSISKPLSRTVYQASKLIRQVSPKTYALQSSSLNGYIPKLYFTVQKSSEEKPPEKNTGIDRDGETAEQVRNYVHDRLAESKFEDGLETEVAIVGGGLGGLYAAYRLMGEEAYKDKVKIFDIGDRICGRLQSIQLPESTVYGELGGMRYFDGHVIVRALIEDEFELDHVYFKMDQETDTRLRTYLRTQNLPSNAWKTNQDARPKGEPPLQTNYKLNPQDVGLSSAQLFNKVFYNVLQSNKWFTDKYPNAIKKNGDYDYTFQIDAKTWDEIKPKLTYNFDGPYKGKRLNDIGFWNLLQDQVGQEGYNFLADGGGYFSNTLNWNAAEAFPYMIGDFSKKGVEFKTIPKGYDLIGYKLAEKFLRGSEENKIYIQNRLVTFRRTEGKYKYELEFEDVSTKKRHIKKVKTNKLVLAMPRRSLELLDQTNFFFKETRHLNHYITSVIPEPSLKLLFGFEYPWWKKVPGDPHSDQELNGESITDLPMRQCYYFGVDPVNSHSLLLASYNDMRTVNFWRAIAPDPYFTKNDEYFWPNTEKCGHKQAEKFQKHYALPVKAEESDPNVVVKTKVNLPTKVMVAEAMAELKLVHNRDDIPEPYVALYKNWTSDPFGGGYHGWKCRYNVAQTMKYMRKPNARESIYICGEAYSTQQGWVEGAFCVVENMLIEHFGVKRGKFFDDDYYLGW